MSGIELLRSYTLPIFRAGFVRPDFFAISVDSETLFRYTLHHRSGNQAADDLGGRTMTGSEKQIEWAKKIKPVIVDMAEDEALQRLISLLNRKGATDSEINGKCATMRKMIRAAADQFESASFWIDARPNGQAPTRETVVAINKIKAAAMRK